MSVKLAAKDAVRNNSKRICSYKACPNSRRGLSSFCSYHFGRTRNYGHPDGEPIKPNDYVYELILIQNFVDNQQNHEGLQVVLKELKYFLDGKVLGFRPEALAVIERIASYGTEPLDVLEICAALTLYSRWRPHNLADDARLTYAMGRQFHFITPTYKQPAGSRPNISAADVRDIGQHLRELTGGLCLNMALSILKEREEIKHLQKVKLKPFKPTSTTIGSYK